jgi:ubiquinone biosynthesis monooxygenase Coq7
MDRLLTAADIALRTLFAPPRKARPYPARTDRGEAPVADALDARQKRLSGALMRVNHVGEVCAQALYTAQAASTRDPNLRRHFEESAREETDHLAWTRQRLDELGSRPSLLNPVWYAGAFALGLIAGRIGDPVSLGFVAETERQVAAHLDSHLARLPANDQASRAVVRQMKADEERHAKSAEAAGGASLPGPVRVLMHTAGKVMTTTAHYI